MLILFIIGFPALFIGAHLLIRGSESLALRSGVSQLTMGLTVVAIGTSTPETIVSILAAVSGAADLALGNIVGSNIVNILFILGLSALINPLPVKSSIYKREVPFALLACLVLLVMSNDRFLANSPQDVLDRGDGLILLAFLTVYFYYLFAHAREGDSGISQANPVYAWPVAVVMVCSGVALMTIGGNWVVSGASDLALQMGVSQALIGLTIVAVGTSLPELITSVLAAYKGNADLAIGNVVGSNIVNIFLILGTSSLINPVAVNAAINIDMLVMIAATITLSIFSFTGGGYRIDRKEGAIFIMSYVAYIAFQLWRK